MTNEYDHSRVKIQFSRCADVLNEFKSKMRVVQMQDWFNEHKVSCEEFEADPLKLLSDSNLVISIDD